MTKEQLFANIEKLLPTLREFQQTGKATLTGDNAEVLRRTYLNILPGVQLDLSCSTCIIHYLNTLLSYYEREYPKYLAEHPQTVTWIEQSDAEKPKRKTRKKNS